MATIGTFTSTGNGFSGAIKTLNRKRSFLRTYAVERGDGMRCPP
ncbi:uncharacterized protein (DUF736 family) [Bradyrhizobium japonicum]